MSVALSCVRGCSCCHALRYVRPSCPVRGVGCAELRAWLFVLPRSQGTDGLSLSGPSYKSHRNIATQQLVALPQPHQVVGASPRCP